MLKLAEYGELLFLLAAILMIIAVAGGYYGKILYRKIKKWRKP